RKQDTPRASSRGGWEWSVKEFFRPFEKTLSKRRVFFPAQFRELLQLRALLGIEPGRHFHHCTNKKIAMLTAVHMDNAFAAKFKHLTALRARWNFQIGFAFQGRHGHLAAERRQRKCNRHLAIQIVLVALENLVLLNVDDDIEIALRS